jgi:hypothetical protein
MGSRGKTEYEDAGVRIAESGHRFGPIFLITIGFATSLADATDIGDEAGTTGAIGYVLLDLTEDR